MDGNHGLLFIFYSSQTDSSSNNNINNYTTKQTKQREIVKRYKIDSQ